MGRMAVDVRADGTDLIYVPGAEHLWRVTVVGDDLVIDVDWQTPVSPSGRPLRPFLGRVPVR